MKTAPDGRTLVSTGEDRKLRLWDLRTSKEVRSFRGHGDAVYSVDVSEDGRFFVSGGMDGCIRVWDVRASGYAASRASLNGEESPTSVLHSFS
jgi:transcription initiation factor TFIID subunit 5